MAEVSVSVSKPKVMEYLDLRLYLADYFAYRKNFDNGFSYEAWAQELGFKSRSYLRMIALGRKKATENFVEAFSCQVFDDERDKEYFHYLVLYSQAKRHRDRQLFGKKLVQILHRVNGQKEIESHYEFLADPCMSRLLVLLSFNDLERSPQQLSAILGRDEKYTKMALEKLEELGLAQRETANDRPSWKSVNIKFKVSSKFGDLGLRAFHESSLAGAMDAISLPPAVRRYRSLLVPLSEEELDEFFQAMDAFANEILMKFQSDSYRQRRLFQFNANIYPVTEIVPEKDAESVVFAE